MAINVLQGQIAVSDGNPGGPSAISNDKSTHVKVVKLTSANFTTGGASNLVIVLPADATIITARLWVKTQLAGGGITAATISLGSSAAGTQFVNASALGFGVAGTFTVFPLINNIFQNYSLPLGPDVQIYATGTATTGNPTSGELYLTIEYVR